MKRLWMLALLAPVLLAGCNHCCGLFGGRLLNPFGTTALSPVECCDPCTSCAPCETPGCENCAPATVIEGNLVPVQPAVPQTYESPTTNQKPPM